jgi:flagellar hook-basal body complex protein FliE
MKTGRGQLSAIERLPRDCDAAIAKAAAALQDRNFTQLEIYETFHIDLEQLKRESRGELDFVIPSFTAFNRFSLRLATMTRRLNETREIASTIAEKFDAGDSDNLTLIAAEAVKTLVFELLTSSGESGMAAKDAMQLANALRAAAQAQGVSTTRRVKVESAFKKDVEKAVDTVGKAKGFSKETTDAILSEILGVTNPAKRPDAA